MADASALAGLGECAYKWSGRGRGEDCDKDSLPSSCTGNAHYVSYRESFTVAAMEAAFTGCCLAHWARRAGGSS